MSWAAGAMAAVAALTQQPAPPDGAATAGDSLRVYLLTFDSGAAVWERFGHNALWIHDPVAGTDRAYDYGRFSFENNFVFRFAMGRLRYWMGEGDVRSYLAAYERQGRRIWSQELDLPGPAKAELQRFLQWNILEANKYYEYDYYLDNCSTRLRDAIDRAVGGALRRFADSIPGSLTYRGHTRRLTENNVFLYTALMAGLGERVDAPTTAWDEMFLPIELRPYLNRLRVADGNGGSRPVVLEQRLLVDSDRFPVPDRPHPWVPRFLAAGGAVGLLLAGLGRLAPGSRAARRGFAVGATGWALLAGLAGALLLFLWTLTNHRFSDANENVLQLNVASLALAAFLPAAVAGDARARRVARALAAIVAGISLLGLALKVTPWLDQANLDVIALVLPIHVGVLVGLRAQAR